jgi:hypothetical protein
VLWVRSLSELQKALLCSARIDTVSKIRKMSFSISEKVFQQDGALQHIANGVLDILNGNSDDKMLPEHCCEWFVNLANMLSRS